MRPSGSWVAVWSTTIRFERFGKKANGSTRRSRLIFSSTKRGARIRQYGIKAADGNSETTRRMESQLRLSSVDADARERGCGEW